MAEVYGRFTDWLGQFDMVVVSGSLPEGVDPAWFTTG